jgi:hypothetical protein
MPAPACPRESGGSAPPLERRANRVLRRLLWLLLIGAPTFPLCAQVFSPVAAVHSTVTAISLLAANGSPNSTFVGDTPSGTAVGTLLVTLSSGTFSGSLALSTTQGGCNGTNGAQNGNWSISGSTLESASGSLASNQAICVLATQGSSSLGQAFALTAAPAGYFVSASGSDSNAGTITAPFATVTKCASTISGGGYCYVRAGTISLTATWNPSASSTFWGYPPDGPNTATIETTSSYNFNCAAGGSCASNITIGDLTITGGAGSINPLFYASANGFYLLQDILTNTSCASSNVLIQGYNSTNVYIQGNTINGCAAGSGGTSDTMGQASTDGDNHSNIYITDNTINGCNRFCLEIASSPGTVSAAHIDRNTFTNWDGGATGGTNCNPGNATGAISYVVPSTSSTPTSTIWGNTLTVLESDKSCVWGIETANAPTSIEYNIFSYAGQALVIGAAAGTEIENNTITLNTSGLPTESYLPNNAGVSEGQDGGYTATEWVGTNTINGNAESGCLASTGTGSPHYCGTETVADWPTSFGTQPTIVSPSSQYQPTQGPPA